MLKLWCTCLVAMVGISAHAQDYSLLPVYDGTTCARNESQRKNPEIAQACLKVEKQSYDKLHAIWPQTTSITREYCQELAEKVGGSYVILLACVEVDEKSCRNKSSLFDLSGACV